MAVVGKLAEAVTVTDPHGWTVYANEAAIDLLRLRDLDELLDKPPGDIMDRFAVYDEDGRPLELTDLPSARLMAGEEGADELLVRNVVRATGEERWLVNKVTLLRGPDGEVRRLINVIEDVTPVKRAERAPAAARGRQRGAGLLARLRRHAAGRRSGRGARAGGGRDGRRAAAAAASSGWRAPARRAVPPSCTSVSTASATRSRRCCATTSSAR